MRCWDLRYYRSGLGTLPLFLLQCLRDDVLGLGEVGAVVLLAGGTVGGFPPYYWMPQRKTMKNERRADGVDYKQHYHHHHG